MARSAGILIGSLQVGLEVPMKTLFDAAGTMTGFEGASGIAFRCCEGQIDVLHQARFYLLLMHSKPAPVCLATAIDQSKHCQPVKSMAQKIMHSEGHYSTIETV